MAERSGLLLTTLIQRWRQNHPKRASGGFWALSGFSFQASTYLLRFFKELIKGNAEPGMLAEMEHLSDILCPSDGRLTLIQVKRTLTKTSLAAALEEAYLLTQLCQTETPALFLRLRFQVVCRSNPQRIALADVKMHDAVQPDGDSSLWTAMLGAFDANEAIVEEPDPLDQLHMLLWNHGIQNTTALIHRCAGRLLQSFEVRKAEEIHEVGRHLAEAFYEAQRQPNWEPVGGILTVNDVTFDADALQRSDVVVDRMPKFEHLRRGAFRERAELFSDVRDAFSKWLTGLESADYVETDKIPAFWISGRSGEGKSVLLLQLVADLLRSKANAPVIQLASGDDLVRLLEKVPESKNLADPIHSRLFAVIDDVYNIRDRDEWDENVRRACSVRAPATAIITCGPTEQSELFASRLSDQFDVMCFDVPHLKAEECQAFIAWYESRTGKKVDLGTLTMDNPLLAQFLFELAQGTSLSTFAKRFKKRLMNHSVFEEARAIIATTALYMDAPLGLVKTEQSRDALERLCREDQLHFRISAETANGYSGSVRLAHPHLSWLLFIEWVEPPATLAKAWAREIAPALRVWEAESNPTSVNSLLFQLLSTARLSDRPVSTQFPPQADKREMIRELYRLHCQDHDGSPVTATLVRWLEIEQKIPELWLKPEPVESALAALADENAVAALPGSVAGWVWLLSESQPVRQEKVAQFLRQHPAIRGVGSAFDLILSKSADKKRARKMTVAWVNDNVNNPQAYLPISSLIAAHPNDRPIKELAIDWLAQNETHPQANHVIASLVVAHPSYGNIKQLAIDWLARNETHPQANHMIKHLVAAHPDDRVTKELANHWLARNETHPQAFDMIAQLVAAHPDDRSIKEQAIDWLARDETHPKADHVIAALIAAHPNDGTIKELAIHWLALNETNRQAFHVIVPLVAAHPDDETIKEVAIHWLTQNETHREAYHVIAALIAAHPNDGTIKELAIHWLARNETHPLAYHVIAPLIAAHPNDGTIKELAIHWLARNETHPTAYHVIAPLVAAHPNDGTIKELAIHWLARNETHPLAYHVTVPLVTAHPNDGTIEQLAIDWLDKNETHPHQQEILRVMIARSNGAEKWLARGQLYIDQTNCRHPEQVISVMLTARKAAPRFIELALNFNAKDSTSKKHREYVLHTLSNSLAHNPVSFLDYLDSDVADGRKNLLCSLIVSGIKHCPQTIPSFVAALVRLSDDHSYFVAKNIVSRGIKSDDLDQWLATWLSDNFRRKGYGGMLQTLQKKPSAWARLLKSGKVSKAIINDFNNWGR